MARMFRQSADKDLFLGYTHLPARASGKLANGRSGVSRPRTVGLILGLSVRHVVSERHLRFARAWLYDGLHSGAV